jgi:hypothetical protein
VQIDPRRVRRASAVSRADIVTNNPQQINAGGCLFISTKVDCECEAQALDTTQPYQTQGLPKIRGKICQDKSELSASVATWPMCH